MKRILALFALVVLSLPSCGSSGVPNNPSVAINRMSSEPAGAEGRSVPSDRPGFAVAFEGFSDNANPKREIVSKMLVFARGASGNVAPLKRLSHSFVYAATSDGSFWTSGPYRFGKQSQPGLYTFEGVLTKALPQEAVAIRRDGSFYEVVGTYSESRGCQFDGDVAIEAYKLVGDAPKLQRSLTLASPCNIQAMTAGADGSLFVATATWAVYSDDPQTTTILHFAPGASGTASPISSARTKPYDLAFGVHLASDSHENAFLVLKGTVYEYLGCRNPVKQLFQAQAIALDSHDDMYAVISYPSKKNDQIAHFEVAEFAPGSVTPYRIVTGSNTEMQNDPLTLNPTLAVVP
jgi:hypothetical protein